METINPIAFVYPPEARDRKHGPEGYTDVQSFRPWLRDDFSFRCVYCLKREQWASVKGDFDIEHFVPTAVAPDQYLNYENLVYACRRCNLRKSNAMVEDPLCHLTSDNVAIIENGIVVGLTRQAREIIAEVAPNSPETVRWRRMWIQIVELASNYDLELLNELMRYPDDLPDLGSLNPPANARPDGVKDSFFAKATNWLPVI
jgi:hypothetical protein